MSKAATRRGDKAIATGIARDLDVRAAHSREDRRAASDERARLLRQVSELERKLRRLGLRYRTLAIVLSVERAEHRAEARRSDFAVRTLLKVIGRLDPTWAKEESDG